MLPIDEFIIWVFCHVTDHLDALSRGHKLRGRGFAPSLTDSEVITMEIVGEFLGTYTDKGIWEYFRSHWLHFFPNLGCRTTFVRQAANLWYWKMRLQNKLAVNLGAFADDIHLVDGLPMSVCRFKRAFFSKVFRGKAAYGYCAAKDEKYYGFHGHLLISFSGVITAFTVTTANADEREALWELLPGVHGLVIGDKGYISASLHEDLLVHCIDLQTALRENMHDDRDPEYVKMLKSARRQVETVIGRLAERYNVERVRAGDIWHLISRMFRKTLSHTVAVFLNRCFGRDPLQFDGLIAT